MKIFITGGCGFIGSNFILKSFESNHNKILNFDKLTYAGNTNNLKNIENNTNYKFVNGDICNSKFLLNTIIDFQPDIILHFAAESHVDRSINDYTNFIETNIVGTANLLNATLKYLNTSNIIDFKFIHISTDEVFGSIEDGSYFDEPTHFDYRFPIFGFIFMMYGIFIPGFIFCFSIPGF